MTLEKVRKILMHHFGLDDNEVEPQMRIEADLGADSLDTIEIVMALEEEFDIEIPDDAWGDQDLTVQQMADKIDSL